MVNSTVSSNFANEISLRALTASSRVYLRATSIFSAAARYFFPCFFIYQLRGANEILESVIPTSLPLKSKAPSVAANSAIRNRVPQLLYRQAHLPRRAFDGAHRTLQA